MIDLFLADSRETPQTTAAARKLTVATFDSLQQIDQLLTRHARHWNLGRLAMVDRNILRLATREFLSGLTPVKVVIAEALRLAQEFSTAESPRFINGVLDAIAKDVGRDGQGTDTHGID